MVSRGICDPFVKTELPLLLDVMARRYGCLPSDLIDLTLDVFQVNFLCMERGIQEEERQIKKAKVKYGR